MRNFDVKKENLITMLRMAMILTIVLIDPIFEYQTPKAPRINLHKKEYRCLVLLDMYLLTWGFPVTVALDLDLINFFNLCCPVK